MQFEQGEHRGFYDLASDRWIKLTLAGRAGYTLDAQEEVPGVRGRLETRPATPAEYLERLRLANEKFGDGIRFLGMVEGSEGWHLVTSQPNVPGGPPQLREIEQFFRANGFRQINDKTWFRAADRLLVGDAHVANLKRTKQGDIVPFDLLIREARGALLRAVEAPAKLEF